MYEEPLRPQFHYSPPRNWINDPNGMVYANEEYHLFYQYNPFGESWGHMSWGHAVSKDLIHWETIPDVALLEEDDIMIFSGSAVYDIHNTSGFAPTGQTPLVAIYSGHQSNPLLQTQNLAYSLDAGRTWIKYSNNPVIDIGCANFRDPKVFWYEPNHCWIMVVSLANECKVIFYCSADLKVWTRLGTFGPEGVVGYSEWECPELFQVVVEDTQETKWILKIDIGDNGKVKTGSASQYFVGWFDGKKFINENSKNLVLWTDFGRDFYAAQCFNHMPDQRNVWIGWMNNWRYANEIPTSPWRGAMSLPRTCTLAQTPQGYRLRQQPVNEIYQLREAPAIRVPQSLIKGEYPLDIRLNVFEIQATINVKTACRCGVRVRIGDNELTEIGYDCKDNQIYLDRSQSGICNFHQDFATQFSGPRYVNQQHSLSLQIFVDRSSVEVFADSGLVVISGRIFPSLESSGISLFADGGEVEFTELLIYPLKAIWAR